jgi:hypothetical protein
MRPRMSAHSSGQIGESHPERRHPVPKWVHLRKGLSAAREALPQALPGLIDRGTAAADGHGEDPGAPRD